MVEKETLTKWQVMSSTPVYLFVAFYGWRSLFTVTSMYEGHQENMNMLRKTVLSSTLFVAVTFSR